MRVIAPLSHRHPVPSPPDTESMRHGFVVPDVNKWTIAFFLIRPIDAFIINISLFHNKNKNICSYMSVNSTYDWWKFGQIVAAYWPVINLSRLHFLTYVDSSANSGFELNRSNTTWAGRMIHPSFKYHWELSSLSIQCVANDNTYLLK